MILILDLVVGAVRAVAAPPVRKTHVTKLAFSSKRSASHLLSLESLLSLLPLSLEPLLSRLLSLLRDRDRDRDRLHTNVSLVTFQHPLIHRD